MRRRASIGLWLSAVMLAALAGCVELTGQRIAWFYDQAKDELQILLYYDGVHDSGTGTEPGTIANFVRDGNVMLLDWPFHVQMAELRSKAADAPDSLERDWARLATSVKTEPVGYYREPDGRIGAVQRITIPRANEFVAKLNALVSRAILRSPDADLSKKSPTYRRILDAAKAGHAWVRLEGQTIRIQAPVHPDEWSLIKAKALKATADGVAKALGDKGTEEEKANFARALRILTSAPVSYVEADDHVELVLGRAKRPIVLRPELRDKYEPSLEKDVAESVKTDVDSALADALLKPGAAPAGAVRAVLDWGPPEEPVRALMAAAASDDVARRSAATRRLAAWAKQWNGDHRMPKAPTAEEYDSAAWRKWYTRVRQFPVTEDVLRGVN